MGGGDWPPPARRQVRHGHLFFSEDGALLRSIHETRTRWAKTLARLPIRSRRPYCARHSSVSWKQHGHSVRTMLEVYAPWADGAVESDVTARRRSIDLPICEAIADQPGLLRRLARRLFRETHEVRPPGPRFSVWHWIWHQERGACT